MIYLNLMLKSWPDIKTALGQCAVFAGCPHADNTSMEANRILQVKNSMTGVDILQTIFAVYINSTILFFSHTFKINIAASIAAPIIIGSNLASHSLI